MEYSKYS